MASINARNGLLFFDFRFQGTRCREYTKLKDTVANRKKMETALAKLEAEITLGQFDYSRWFPGSKNAEKFVSEAPVIQESITPLFKDFAELWFSENCVAWRRSHIATQRSTLDKHLLPEFGDCAVGDITKAQILQFRIRLSELPGRCGNKNLSAKTINRVLQILSQILDEAADRFDIGNAAEKVKRLKQKRVDIEPFTLAEVQLLIAAVRPDFCAS